MAASSRTTFIEPGRLIFGLMVFTVGFSVVGSEIEKNNGGKPPLNPAIIIFGGTVATSLLTLLSHAGEAGEHFAVGLATISFTTAALVFGGPVWERMNKAFGSKPTKPIPTTQNTGPTPATAAAIDVATATAA